ncbi:unnamed protein product, partial [Ectocarpus sp. 4 AP-2014]
GAPDDPVELPGARRGELVGDVVVVVAETPKKHPQVHSQLPSTRKRSMRPTARNFPSPPAAIFWPPTRRASSAGRTICSTAKRSSDNCRTRSRSCRNFPRPRSATNARLGRATRTTTT